MLTKSYSPKVGFVSLGCPKAGSDTEKILSRVKAEGYEISSNFINSDLVIVNTCGFIDSAIEESLDAIDEAMQKNGNVIVTGCLGEKRAIIEGALKIFWQLPALKHLMRLWTLFINIYQSLMTRILILSRLRA